MSMSASANDVRSAGHAEPPRPTQASQSALTKEENERSGQAAPAATVPDAGPQPEPVERRESPPGDPAVVAVEIGKRFGERAVVQGLTFEVQRGTIFGIIGPSGCGKTTTIRMLLGVFRPTTGDLRVLGRHPHTFRRRDRERLGYMPQQFVLFPELSVMENMGFAASIYGMSFFGRGRRIRRTLDLVELWDARDRPAGQLSGGMQRRLELAATLVHDPEVIFLDEPTAGVDPVLRAKFWEHFRALRDEGRTLICTTQYVTESEYCDEILVLREGQKVATGTPEDVRRQAIGGEVVTVTGPDLDRHAVTALRSVDGVQKVSWDGQDRLKVIVEDAGSTVPDLMDALRSADIEVDEVSEQHASFDDVFVQLMEAQPAGEDRAQSNQ
jgi:ABC-2 type transport system ATP-binding protein